jgi:ArsR family transcriptional regulator
MSSAEKSVNRFLQAVADPTRRRILHVLRERNHNASKNGGLCASDIEHNVKVSQPTISHHMAVLKSAGIIEVHKQGRWMWYKRDEKAIAEFARRLREFL